MSYTVIDMYENHLFWYVCGSLNEHTLKNIFSTGETISSDQQLLSSFGREQGRMSDSSVSTAFLREKAVAFGQHFSIKLLLLFALKEKKSFRHLHGCLKMLSSLLERYHKTAKIDLLEDRKSQEVKFLGTKWFEVWWLVFFLFLFFLLVFLLTSF